MIPRRIINIQANFAKIKVSHNKIDNIKEMI